MIQIPNMTIWTIVWNDDLKWISKAGQVLRYCATIIDCEKLVLFTSGVVAKRDYPFDVVQIPKLNWQSYNIFVNRVVPVSITSDFAMCVHEDGFPIDTSQWTNEFLNYDYIGAPWPDGVVGNGGFSIESQKMMRLKREMPVLSDEFSTNSDRLLCDNRRKYFEGLGVGFAPKELAAKFSTEQTDGHNPSFGFHGRLVSAAKYKAGWIMVNRANVSRDGFTKEGNKIVPPPPRMPVSKDPKTSLTTQYIGSGKPIRDGMKICIATAFDRKYAIGGATMIKTAKRYTELRRGGFQDHHR